MNRLTRIYGPQMHNIQVIRLRDIRTDDVHATVHDDRQDEAEMITGVSLVVPCLMFLAIAAIFWKG